MDVWQRPDLEQSDRPAREQGDPARRGQPRRLLEIAAHALQIRRHAVARRPLQTLLLECLERLAHTVLHLDERSEEHTSELQSRLHLVCRLLLEKKKKK